MNRSILIAIIIAVAAVGWLLTGVLGVDGPGNQDSANASEGSAATEASSPTAAAGAVADPAVAPAEKPQGHKTSVRTRISESAPHAVQITVRGRTESVRTVEVRAQTQGRVEQIYRKKGDRVAKGDPIVRLAAGDRSARLAETEALIKQREIEYEADRKLNAKGYRADTQVVAGAAALDAAKAARMSMEVDIAYLTVRAPFDGVISSRPVQLGAFLKVGDPVAVIVDQDPILAIGNISEREIGQVEIGTPAEVVLIDGRKVNGKVRFISPIAEPSTRTFRTEIEIDNPDRSIRDGITAEIMLEAGSVPAHFLTPAILTLNDAGVIGVRTVDRNRQVAFIPISIIADGPEGVWVSGLPPQVQIITVGQEFVREGQVVDVALAE